MPEIRECIAHWICMRLFFEYCLQRKIDLRLLALWADATDKEEKTLAPDGLVYRLDATSTVKRGNANKQSSLWPPTFQKTRSIQTLSLKGVAYSNRTLILDMGPLFFQLAYLTHTSIQFFDQQTWQNVVMKTHKDIRKYYIGLAMELKDYVIAFVSQDQVVQPGWSETFPTVPTDVYSDYYHFLSEIAAWIQMRASSKSKRLGLAIQVMKSNGNKIWCGVGVYTANELFHDSGISPFLTEAEVFDCPSRTARLCEALWSYAYKSHTSLHELITPCVVDGIIAPTKEQRLRYLRWLHVHSKDGTKVTPHMHQLVNQFEQQVKYFESLEDPWYRDTAGLVDFFEPTYIKDALTMKAMNLGSLIFGQDEWQKLRANMQGTHLPVYETLFDETPPQRYRHLKTYTYKVPIKKVWSVVRAFPENSWVSKEVYHHPKIHRCEGFEREALTFKYIVTRTNSVAIGPLEYCGNGPSILQNPVSNILLAPRLVNSSSVLASGPHVVTPHTLNQVQTPLGETSLLRLYRLGNRPSGSSGYTDAHAFYERLRKYMQSVAYAGDKAQVVSIKVEMKYLPKRKATPALFGDGLVEMQNFIPVHIGVEELKLVAFHIVLPSFLKWSHNFPLAITDVEIRDKYWVKFLPRTPDRDAISNAFFTTGKNPKFKMGQALIYLAITHKLLEKIYDHMEAMENPDPQPTGPLTVNALLSNTSDTQPSLRNALAVQKKKPMPKPRGRVSNKGKEKENAKKQRLPPSLPESSADEKSSDDEKRDGNTEAVAVNSSQLMLVALLDIVYDFVRCFKPSTRTSTIRSPAIPELRFVNFGLFIADDRTQVFLVEEFLEVGEKGTGSGFYKYINNSSAKPLLRYLPDSDYKQSALFLSFAQHVQFIKTKRMVYTSDFQGTRNRLMDPQIITSNDISSFGEGNLNHDNFIAEHECNEYCRYYGLAPLKKEPLFLSTGSGEMEGRKFSTNLGSGSKAMDISMIED